jgi:SAM-dependent methyltransferase
MRGRHPGYLLSELNAFHTTQPMPSIDSRLIGLPNSAEVKGRPPVSRDYIAADEHDRMDLVRQQYNAMDAHNLYATSRDYNNRELEIDAIRNFVVGSRVLDIGCGNGYTLLTLGTLIRNGRLVGVDFSENMIEGARTLLKSKFTDLLETQPEFVNSDVESYLETVKPGQFDTIISERLIVNLPSWNYQREIISAIVDRLAAGGRYLMIEGSAKGFRALNELRVRCGLDEIPDKYAGNESSCKLDDDELARLLASREDVRVTTPAVFDFYSIASKVLHPLLVAPEQPRFASPINDISRIVQQSLTHENVILPEIGAAKMWVIEKT